MSANHSPQDSISSPDLGSQIILGKDKALSLECGTDLARFPMSFQTYGQLNTKRTNAILVCHALSGDQYAAGRNPITKKSGFFICIIL